MNRLRYAICAALLLVISLVFTGPALVNFLCALLFGWISSGWRLGARWRPEPTSLMWFAATAAVFVIGTHVFIRWLHNAVEKKRHPSVEPPTWQLQWTLSGIGILTCALIALISMVLTVHQTYWLRTTTVPWFADRVRAELVVARKTALDVASMADEEGWNAAKVKAGFLQKGVHGKILACELFQPIWIEENSEKLKAIVLVPRRSLWPTSAKVEVLKPGGSTRSPLKELPHLLASFGVDLQQYGVESGRLAP